MDELKNLKDIKPPIEISDYSLWILVAIILLAFTLFVIIAYILKKKFRKKRHFFKSDLELARECIKSIDYSNPKSVTYRFIEDVSKFVEPNRAQEYKSILKDLDDYKYKKEVPQMSKALQARIKNFIKGIRWRV